MRIKKFFPLLFLLLIGTPAYSGVEWEQQYASTLHEAKIQRKPVMIHFYTPWCGWCQRLDKEVYTDIAVINFSKNFINVRINGDQSAGIIRKHGVRSYPTIIFLDCRARELGRIGGYVDVPVFLEHMRIALDRFEDVLGKNEPTKPEKQPVVEEIKDQEEDGAAPPADYEEEKKEFITASNLIRKADACYKARDYYSARWYYKAIIDLYPETPSAQSAMEKIDKLHAIAERYLTTAEFQYHQGDFTAARDNFRVGLGLFPESDQATRAYKRLQEIETNEAIQKEIIRQALEEDAFSLLQLADNYRSAGRDDLAVEHYRRLIEQYPKTRYVEEAKRRLSDLAHTIRE